jgi:AraC-like DNA-binding protein
VNRLYFVNSGSATVRIGAKEWVLTEGHFYVLPRSESFVPMAALEFDHTYFDFYYSRILNNEKIIELDEGTGLANNFFDYVNDLIKNDSERNAFSAMEHFLCGFFSLCECQKIPLPYITNPTVTEALSLIHTECADVSTKILAQKLNIDESYFIRIFSSVTGITPMKYIRAYRVSMGKQLIRNGASIAEAAEKCGYASPSSFYNAVKAELNISPSDFKEEH